jgi:hypothetical protein
MRDVSPRTYTIPIYSSYHVNKTQFSKSVIFQKKNWDFPQKPLLQICPSKIMIITSHMQKFIQIHHA